MTSSPTDIDRIAETRLRTGRHDDIPAIARLIHRANAANGTPHIDEHELEMVAGRGQLIVLQLQPDEVAAAACVAAPRGLVFLVIDPAIMTSQLEHRMLGVADAVCEAAHERAAGGGG